MMKRSIALLLLGTITTVSLPIQVFGGEMSTTLQQESSPAMNHDLHKQVDNGSMEFNRAEYEADKPYIYEVEPYIIKNVEGYIELSNKMPRNIINEDNLNLLRKRFDELNKGVRNGEIIINNDLSITRITVKNEIEARVPSGFRKHSRDQRFEYWWGMHIGYCEKCTKDAAYELSNTALSAGVIGTILGGIPGAAIVAAIMGGWSQLLANKMNYYNNSKGVWVDLNYALVYSVYKQA